MVSSTVKYWSDNDAQFNYLDRLLLGKIDSDKLYAHKIMNEPCEYLKAMDAIESDCIVQDHEKVRRVCANHTIGLRGAVGSAIGVVAGGLLGSATGTKTMTVVPISRDALGFALLFGTLGAVMGSGLTFASRKEDVAFQIEHIRLYRLSEKIHKLSHAIGKLENDQEKECIQMNVAHDFFVQTVLDYKDL